jgi:hypothetical protein
MEVIEIPKNLYKSLSKLRLDSKIFNTEAEIYVIPNKEHWKKNSKILKKLYNDQGDIFGNKLLTVNALIDKKDIINIPEMILPDKIATYNHEIIGFTLDYIKNINFDLLLGNPKFDDEFKRTLLIEAGIILEKMKKLRNNGIVDDFYLNDIHEANFIYNLETGHLNVVDVDSASISGNKPFAAKYLTPFSQVAEMPYKYIVSSEKKYPGYIIPSENSDLYCYNIMVLNYLFHDKINKLDITEFYVYLNYLESLGYNHDILDTFYKLYEPCDNESIAPFIDSFPKSIEIITKSRKRFFDEKCNIV